MIYALTYMPDEYIDNVNTIIIQANDQSCIESELEDILCTTGMDHKLALYIVKNKSYYIKSCENIDYTMLNYVV